MAAMYAMGTTWAKRLRTVSGAMAGGTEAVSGAQFEEILRSKRPYTIAAIGFVGLLVILWLMIFKPTLGFGGVAECVPSPMPPSRSVRSTTRRFVPSSLDVPAGEPLVVAFENEDDAVQHNVAIYTDDTAAESHFVGDLVEGPTTVTYDVPALDPGEYYFRCDVHPQMDGTLEAA